MKKVLILGNHAIGLYNFRIELIERLIKDGFEVHFSVPKHKKVDDIINAGGIYHQVHINRRGTRIIEDIKLFFHYCRLMIKVKPNIILTYTIKPNIYGCLAARLFRIPYIANITGLGTALQKETPLSKVLRYLYRIALKKSAAIFYQNVENESYFKRYKIVSSDRSINIPGSGVNLSKFTPMNKTNCDNVIRFIFVGRAMKDKGINEYLSVAENIKKTYNNVEFQILGSFEDDIYRDKILALNKRGIIRYLGESNDTRQQVKEVDCIILPSYHEGMSNVLLEGAAMEKPLIATNIHGCKEAIEEGVNGFLVEPKSVISLQQAVEKFIKLTQDERKQMGQCGREKMILEFDRNIVINKYIEVIEGILA